MKVTGAWHTGLQVSDLDASLTFYRDLLGFAEIWRRQVKASYIGRLVGCPGLELHQALLQIPGTEHRLELLEYRNVPGTPIDPHTANPGTAHICLSVDELDALYEKLLAAGVAFVSEPVMPTEGPNTDRLAVYMLDPDGIRIELVQTQPLAVEGETPDPAASRFGRRPPRKLRPSGQAIR